MRWIGKHKNWISRSVILLLFFKLLFLFFKCLFSDLFLAERAVIVLFKPLFNAFTVKVMLFIARQRNDIIRSCKLNHAYWAFSLRLKALRVEFCSVQGLNELWSGRHPIRTLCTSNSYEKHWYHNTDEHTVTATFKHVHITCQNHQEEA